MAMTGKSQIFQENDGSKSGHPQHFLRDRSIPISMDKVFLYASVYLISYSVIGLFQVIPCILGRSWSLP